MKEVDPIIPALFLYNPTPFSQLSHYFFFSSLFFLFSRREKAMAIPLSVLLFLLPLLSPTFISSSPVQDPELVVEEVHKYECVTYI